MSLNYSFTGDWDGATKESVGKWVKEKLTVVQDGEAPEDLFLEYIIVMIGNGKKMQELSHELQDFIGEKSANDFATDLGTYLQNITVPEISAQPLLQIQEPQKIALVAGKSHKDILDGGLQSSRSNGTTVQKSSRLLDSALKSTTSSQRKIAPRNQSSQPEVSLGITTQSSKQNVTGIAGGPGLFTKRGIANSINIPPNQNGNGDDMNKKRRIIMEGSNGQSTAMNRGIVYGGFHESEVPFGDGRMRGTGFGPGSNFPQPMPVGFPGAIDPSMMYMEQMNIMARMSGFGSAEEMMFFQQNMMANMMGGAGMPMSMPMPIPSPFGGRPMPQYEQRHQVPMHHAQFGRGHGPPIGGRGGRGFQRGSAGQVTNTSISRKIDPPPGPPPPTSMPPPTPTQPVQSIAQVKQKVTEIPPALTDTSLGVSSSEELHDGTFDQYGVGGSGGYRGRGRGRGHLRGGFYGEVAGRGRGSPAIDESGGRFGVLGRGRGSYRGRGGYHGGRAPLVEGAPSGGPPVSHNKVWVREVDMESSLVAGR